MITKNTVKIVRAKIISLEIICPSEYVGQIITIFGEFFSKEYDPIRGVCHLKPFDYCVSYTKRFSKKHIENEFHIIVSFSDSGENIRNYNAFISYLRETKNIPIECPSPNELFGE